MYQIQVSILRDLIFNAVKRGVDFQDACSVVDVTPEQLMVAEGYISFEKAGQFWTYAVEKTQDQLLGLRMGQDSSPTFLGVLSYLLQHCRTVAEAYGNIVKFNDTVSSVLQYRIEEKSDKALLIFDLHPIYKLKYPEAARQAVDLSVSNLLTAMMLFTGKTVSPLLVTLTESRRHAAEYEKILQTKVEFSSDANRMVLSRSDYHLPIVKRDESLYELFNGILLKKQGALTNQLQFSDRIRQIILAKFKGQAPPIDALASHLNLTARTLQRKLEQEGTSYREIVAQVVQDLAEEMSSLNVRKEDISMLLGYADSSVLRRMSKKWSDS